MVMAAGLGTRLRPLTHEIPKPLVPVANRPIMEHILELLGRQGFGEVVANLHWFGEVIRARFGDGASLGVEVTYSEEPELLGTAGGVRNVRSFFGDDPFVVMAADALTDIDLGALARTHERNDWLATLAVKEVKDTSEYGVVVTGSDDRVQGFQEKPDPAEALSNLANCMIYVLEPEIFDHFPDQQEVDFALDVFPALLEGDIPFGVHVTDAYWNDVGSLPEYLKGNLDALTGAIDVAPAGTLLSDGDAEGLAPGVEVDGPVLLGDGAEVGEGAQLDGPLVIGPGARIGAGARLRESVLLPGTEVPAAGLLAGAIAGSAPALADPGGAASRGEPS
jgi:mannose-1-phosphate guanylyltransferase/mannose-1-phosphate guanylyltransferase/phosphomannomutase